MIVNFGNRSYPPNTCVQIGALSDSLNTLGRGTSLYQLNIVLHVFEFCTLSDGTAVLQGFLARRDQKRIEQGANEERTKRTERERKWRQRGE